MLVNPLGPQFRELTVAGERDQRSQIFRRAYCWLHHIRDNVLHHCRERLHHLADWGDVRL